LVSNSTEDWKVVKGVGITDHVLIPEEEHNRARIIQLVHGFEVWHFVKVTDV
jgi:hypothetical protein